AEGAMGAGAKGASGARGARGARLFAAGLCLGAAFALKYNAGLYVVVVLLALALTTGVTLVDAIWIGAGSLVIPLALLAVFWHGGALDDLNQATIVYNVRYSGETYASKLDVLKYLIRFPIDRARLDALWFLGGLGSLVLLVAGARRRVRWLPVVWVAAGCLSVAIKGRRGVPPCFVPAAPALSLSPGLGAAVAPPPLPRPGGRVVGPVLSVGVWRVGDDPFPKLASNVWLDTQYVFGRTDRRTHLSRFGGTRETDKFSALANYDLGAFLASKTKPEETVYIFGFSPAAYVYAD